MVLERQKLSGGQLVQMHSVLDCRGPCPVHDPSVHSMRTMKLSYRWDKDLFERICDHGVGHPDPDNQFMRDTDWVHGCDGCCVSRETSVIDYGC